MRIKRSTRGGPDHGAMGNELEAAVALGTSAALGLLVGLERERNPLTKAGLRTFALVAMLGALSVMVARELDAGWIVAAALVVSCGAIAGASLIDPATRSDASGTTTVAAALVVFTLGAMIALGHRQVAVGAGVAMTALLYFKNELEGLSLKLTAQDLSSMLRFAILTAVILPLLPDRPLAATGALAAVNPYNVWLMVVLISGVSLAGYVAWRLTLGRHGLLVTGLLGGLVSSTSTTFVAARNAKTGTQAPAEALTVILLANATMFARVTLIVGVVAPALVLPVAAILGPALLLAVPAFVYHWRHAGKKHPGDGATYANPTNLVAAIGFGLGYSVVLVISSLAAAHVGTQGVYALAAASGLTDVDAITLSLLRLFEVNSLAAGAAATAVAIAVGANLVMKAGLVLVAGGRALGFQAALGFLLPFLAIAVGASIGT